MKKFVILVLFVVVTLSAGELTFDVSIPSIKSAKTRDVSGYTRLTVPDYYTFPTPGSPSVPYKVIRALIPPTASIEEVSVEKMDSIVSGLSSPLFPVQEPAPIIMDHEVKFTEPDELIYSSDKEFPGYIVENLGVGEMSGFRIAQIALYPVQYMPKKNTLIIYSLEVRLKYQEEKVKAKRMTEKQYRIFEEIIADIVDNPEAVDAYRSVIWR